MEIYENHLGGIYFDEWILNFDDLYCEQCGDSDTYLGHADTWEDVLDMITDEDGWCRYDEEYLGKLKSCFETYIEDPADIGKIS